ncbi:MAG: hypothetical protein RLZZ142_455, partial [Verrucomicrobiota bacterium]
GVERLLWGEGERLQCWTCSRRFGGRGGGGGGGGGSGPEPAREGLGTPGGRAPCAQCPRCVENPPAFECAVAVCRTVGVVRRMIHGLKYEGREYLAPSLGRCLAEGLGDGRLRAPLVEVLVPVPLHWRRLWGRGFNQALVLARELGRARGLPVVEALRRVRDTGTQTRLGRSERWENLRGAFGLRRGGGARVGGRHVLLVDDVLTTGATLDACARVLRRAGAASVRALAVARG